MTVRDLIEKLKTYPENSLVLVDGYEGGFAEILGVQEKLVKLNVNVEDYLGPHDEAPNADTKVVVIGRNNSR